MSIEKLRPSFTFTDDRLHDLQAVVPEAFADGKINWDSFRETLGENLEESEEHFGLNWPGKRQARRLAATSSKGTIVQKRGEGINEENAQNIFIEGDNLEVLKLLQKSYASRVKMIYIDPPYNTGNDFIYKDNYQQSVQEYLGENNLLDEKGQLLTTNSKTDGRYHTNWLNMMYPRLMLARQTLNEDGIIFVSIDDHELENLRQLMNEVFGEENFVANLVWRAKSGGGSDKDGIVTDHEYIICFQKSAKTNALSRITIEAEQLDKIDEKGPYRRGRELNKWGANSRREDRPTMYFPVDGPNGEQVYPIRNDGAEGCWRWGKKKMLEIVERKDVDYVKRQDGTYIVYEKIRSSDPRTKPYRTLLENTGTTADGSKTVKELFDGKKVFDFPKPVALIKQLIEMGTINSDDIILDFFAGSCTTAQAIFEYNQEIESELRFILVQLAEPTSKTSEAYKNGYLSIADLGRERIKRSLGYVDKKDNINTLSANDGVKVFSYSQSNFLQWSYSTDKDISQLQLQFNQAESPLIGGWQPENLLIEIILLQGFPLDSKIGKLPNFKKNNILQIDSGFCTHQLYVCLDPDLFDETVATINTNPEDIFVCLDSALTDEAKLRLSDRCNLKVI